MSMEVPLPQVVRLIPPSADASCRYAVASTMACSTLSLLLPGNEH